MESELGSNLSLSPARNLLSAMRTQQACPTCNQVRVHVSCCGVGDNGELPLGAPRDCRDSRLSGVARYCRARNRQPPRVAVRRLSRACVAVGVCCVRVVGSRAPARCKLVRLQQPTLNCA